ncbi:MAG TPA: hypothetical protein VMM76_12865 [Pirellulaceae bacterium]|nr:hypothetical protein [Pirellulaceae bacterium]
MQRLGILILAAIVLLPSIPLQLSAVEPSGWRDPDALVSFRPTGRMIRAPLTIGGKTFLFVLDTGCETTVVDESLRPLLGPALGHNVLNSGFGKAQCTIHERPEIRIGGAIGAIGGAIGDTACFWSEEISRNHRSRCVWQARGC